MSTLVTRNPDIIAAEINSIKEQARGLILQASVEIGRRLKEAKAMVKHGEWAEWLENNVDYSQRTANDLMAIADGYGEKANSQTFANLGYSQAVALLGLPASAREEFIQTHDVENTPVRELTEQVRVLREQLEGKQADFDSLIETLAQTDARASAEREKAEGYLAQLKDADASMKALREQNRETVDKLKAEIEAARAENNADKLQKLEGELAKAKKKAEKTASENAELARKLHEAEDRPPEIMQVLPPEAEEELIALRDKVKKLPDENVARFRVQFETLTAQFGALIDTLDKMSEDSRSRYAGAVHALLEKMGARL